MVDQMWMYVLIGGATILFLWRWIRSRGVISDFSKRHVFVTGCDHGFGNMLVKRLDDVGFNVFAGCLTITGSEKLKQETSKRVTVLPLDVTSTESIQNAFEFVTSKLNRQKASGLWGLVNNAGIAGPIAPSEWIPKEDFQRVLDVNTLGMIETCRIFLPLVLQVKGRIVNITSMMGRIAASPAPYVTSKFAAEGYSDMLRRELYRRGVTVHILEPGFFETNIIRTQEVESTQKYFNRLPKHLQKYYGQSYVDSTLEISKEILQRFASPNTDLVIDAYMHALTSKHPKHRYIVGNDAKYFFRVLWNLPESVADYILGRKVGIPEAELSQ